MAAKKDQKSEGQKMEEKLLLKQNIVAEDAPGMLDEAMAYGEEYIFQTKKSSVY